MSMNATLADRFEQMARLLELTGGNKFKVNAYARAGRVLADHADDLAQVVSSAGGAAGAIERLTAIEGIGKGIAERIVEFVTTGAMAEHVELLASVPAGLIKVMEVPGLGPKTVAAMWQQLGVVDVAGLRAAIDDGRLLTLPRMGEKAVEKIKQSLAFVETSGARLHLGKALPLARALMERLRAVPGVESIEHAGSLRRGQETIGDIDLLAVTEDAPGLYKVFRELPGVMAVLAAGDTKASVRMAVDAGLGRWAFIDEQPAGDGEAESGASGAAEGTKAKPAAAIAQGVQVDLRAVPRASFGAALMYFTGSKEHNVRMRERALKRGLTLNEYGLYPDEPGATEPPHKRGVRAVAGATEAEVFSALGLPWIPPELRQNRGELELRDTPRLVELSDIRSELHSHTTASDGSMSLREAAARAATRGFHTLAITDHSKSTIGLSERKLREHVDEVRKLDAMLAAEHKATTGDELAGLRLLAGSEVDILLDGTMDYSDPMLRELDIVVASPHQGLSQDPVKATKRLIKAIEHPSVHILGHPTGRLIGKRKGLEPAMSEIYAAAKQHGVALEINCHWLRLDLRDAHVRAAVEAGCLIAIDCDVHGPDDYDNLVYGVLTARRGWCPAERVVNTWGAAELRAWLRRKR